MRISVYKNDVMGLYESNVHKVETEINGKLLAQVSDFI
jgi:hypothetical protein